MKNLFAFTAPSGSYPEYVSVNRTENGDVEITVREKPETYDGIFICGYSADKGKHGRCTPGDDNCNNYCNMAPQKGPMQERPLPCTHTKEGRVVSITVPAEAWEGIQI